MTLLASGLGRLHRFVGQMFPVLPVQTLVLGSFILNYLMLSRFLVPKEASTLELFCGGVTMVLLNLLLRIFDELKDYESDKVNFPDRPLVSGVVSHGDLYAAIAGIVLLTLALQVPFLLRPVFPTYLVTLGFCFLMLKWFFLERIIRPSLPLALLTHHPVVFIFQLYTLSFFANPLEAPIEAVLYLFGVGLGATCWEISRKMRGRREEDAYTTYTKIWGILVPSMLVAAFTTAAMLMTLLPLMGVRYIRLPVILGAWALPAAAAFAVFVLLIRFTRTPDKAPPIRKAVEAFGGALLIAALVAVVGA